LFSFGVIWWLIGFSSALVSTNKITLCRKNISVRN